MGHLAALNHRTVVAALQAVPPACLPPRLSFLFIRVPPLSQFGIFAIGGESFRIVA